MVTAAPAPLPGAQPGRVWVVISGAVAVRRVPASRPALRRRSCGREAGDELGMRPPPPGETECPEFCGGTVIVVDLSQPRHRRRSRRRGSGRSLLRHGSAARPAASGGRRSRVRARRAVRRWCPRPGRYRAPARPGAGPLPTGPHRGRRRSLCCSGTPAFCCPPDARGRAVCSALPGRPRGHARAGGPCHLAAARSSTRYHTCR